LGNVPEEGRENKSVPRDKDLHRLLRESLGQDPAATDRIRMFTQRLESAQTSSVDSFLARQEPDSAFVRIGRTCIAYEILQTERTYLDDEASLGQFKKAKEIIRKARRILIAGFGFDEHNMQNLGYTNDDGSCFPRGKTPLAMAYDSPTEGLVKRQCQSLIVERHASVADFLSKNLW
jgi:hypothetical protein